LKKDALSNFPVTRANLFFRVLRRELLGGGFRFSSDDKIKSITNERVTTSLWMYLL